MKMPTREQWSAHVLKAFARGDHPAILKAFDTPGLPVLMYKPLACESGRPRGSRVVIWPDARTGAWVIVHYPDGGGVSALHRLRAGKWKVTWM